MNKSYRKKMDMHLHNKELTREYVIGAIERYNTKISQRARMEKKYRYCQEEEYQADPYYKSVIYKYKKYRRELYELMAYRRPLIILLMNEFGYSLAEIKKMCAEFDKKNIPTYTDADRIIELVNGGEFKFV